VNIYGSQEAFIKVYKQMLDERLLYATNVTYEKELKDLELMKLRFGDANLHQCEVMLRDIKDSERINREV
jgi:anaphase-promoting complex subunit 2|tara:strand:- start:360 stop:569 length:210 start_codon:yes stop_codon:yes gene_type:complete